MESNELKKMLNEIIRKLKNLERKVDDLRWNQYDRARRIPPYVPPYDEEDDVRHPYEPYRQNPNSKKWPFNPQDSDDDEDDTGGGISPQQR
jgi:hypothetical protein